MMKKIFSYIVIVSSFFCLLGAASVLFWQNAGIAFSSRWVLNRVLLALPTSMLFGILALTQYTKESIRSAMLVSLLCMFVVATVSGAMTLGSGIAVIVRFYSVYLFYQKKYLQLHTRTNRSILNYSMGFTPLFVTLVALITSIAMITAVAKHGVGCATIEASFRFPSMITLLETTSLSDILGIDVQQAQRMQQDKQGEEVSSGLLGGFFLIKERIVDLVVEQKEFLNHTMCGVIDTQLQKIQQRQRWQIAGIALLFVLMRPLIALLMRVVVLVTMAVWWLLLYIGMVKKKKILVEATTVYLLKGL